MSNDRETLQNVSDALARARLDGQDVHEAWDLIPEDIKEETFRAFARAMAIRVKEHTPEQPEVSMLIPINGNNPASPPIKIDWVRYKKRTPDA